MLSIEELEMLNPTELGKILLEEVESDYPSIQYIKNLALVGCPMTYQTEEGRTPLHIASQASPLAVVKSLVLQGADVNFRNIRGSTALHAAACAGRVDVMRYLLAAGADVNVQMSNHATPLHYASGHGHIAAVKILVSHGADVNSQMNNHATPLHYASGLGHLAVVEFLVSQGGDIDIEMCNGHTPIVVAACGYHLNVIEYLFEVKADRSGWEGSDDVFIERLNPAFELRDVEILMPNNGHQNPAIYYDLYFQGEIVDQLSRKFDFGQAHVMIYEQDDFGNRGNPIAIIYVQNFMNGALVAQ